MQSQVFWNFSLWVLLAYLGCLSEAYFGFGDSGEDFDHLWVPRRRSLQCKQTYQECHQTSQCCNENDVCLRGDKQLYSGREVGVCMNIDIQKANPEKLKDIGENCEDSYECGIGLCCRAILRFRLGVVHRCDFSEGPYICLSSDEKNNIPGEIGY